MNEDDVTFTDPETGEIEDISPGSKAPDGLYHDETPGFDYDKAASTWVGEPARVEIQIETIGGAQVKRFVLAEPDDQETMDALIIAAIERDNYEFCADVVEKPVLSPNRWHELMTERERQLLFDHAYGWLQFGQFLTAQQATEQSDI